MGEIISRDTVDELTNEEREMHHAHNHLKLAITMAEALGREVVEVHLDEAKIILDSLVLP